jgi:hypothetical protein
MQSAPTSNCQDFGSPKSMPTKEMADDCNNCSSHNVQNESGGEHEEEDGGVKIGIVKTLYEELGEMKRAKERVGGGNVDFPRETHMHDKAEKDAEKVPSAAKLKISKKGQHQEELKVVEANINGFGGGRVRILKRGEMLDSGP